MISIWRDPGEQKNCTKQEWLCGRTDPQSLCISMDFKIWMHNTKGTVHTLTNMIIFNLIFFGNISMRKYEIVLSCLSFTFFYKHSKDKINHLNKLIKIQNMAWEFVSLWPLDIFQFVKNGTHLSCLYECFDTSDYLIFIQKVACVKCIRIRTHKNMYSIHSLLRLTF